MDINAEIFSKVLFALWLALAAVVIAPMIGMLVTWWRQR